MPFNGRQVPKGFSLIRKLLIKTLEKFCYILFTFLLQDFYQQKLSEVIWKKIWIKLCSFNILDLDMVHKDIC